MRTPISFTTKPTSPTLRYFASAFSMAATICGESGVTSGSNRATTLPLRSNRNFVKFHLISPPVVGFADESVRYWYSGVMSDPFTETFDIIGNCTLYFRVQKVLISSFVPGSCAPKLLAGTPTITRPRSLYFSYTDSNAEYWGVYPQRLATLTTISTLPL